MSSRKIKPEEHIYKYITNLSYYYMPKFPMTIKNIPHEFNLLDSYELMELYRRTDSDVQKTALMQTVIVLGKTVYTDKTHKSESGHGGYLRIMNDYYDGYPSYVFPVTNPILITDFIKTEESKMGRNIVLPFRPDLEMHNLDLIKRAIDHGMCVTDCKNVIKELLIYAISRHPRNLYHLPDELIDDEIRTEIKKLDENGKLKSLVPSIGWFYSKCRSFTEEEVEILRKNIFAIINSEIDKTDEITDTIQKIKVVLKDTAFEKIIPKWLENFHDLPTTLSYKLETIGYADEEHAKNHHWVQHLKKKTKCYLNITKACYVRCFRSFHSFMRDQRELFDLFTKIGLNIVFYSQSYWRRGTSISVSMYLPESFDLNMYKDHDCFNIFIKNKTDDYSDDELNDEPGEYESDKDSD